MRLHSVFIIFIVAKVFVDFLFPERWLSFALVGFFILLFPLLLRYASYPKFSLVAMMAFYVVVGGAIRTEDWEQALKFSVLWIYFYCFFSLVKRLSLSQRRVVAEYVLRAVFIAFCANYIISVFRYNVADREFYVFEHVNLLGSYLVAACILLPVIASTRGAGLLYKGGVVVCTFLSTSTGALACVLLSSLNVGRLSVRSVGFLILAVVGGGVASYFFTESQAYDLHVKLFGPIQLVLNGELPEIYRSAKLGLTLSAFDEAYQSSLTWRFYAYSYYFVELGSRSLWALFWGGGVGSFSTIYNGYMPHNDFILVLVDFGIIGLALFFLLLKRLHAMLLAAGPEFRIIFWVLVVRLLTENNIYSFYLMSFALTVIALVGGKGADRQWLRQGYQS
ncbi:MAG: hypothetical protein ACRERR_06015 [Moraxellaceae bacterium]